MKIKVFGAGSAFKDLMAFKGSQIEVVACFSNTPSVSRIMNVPVVDSLNEFIQIPSVYVVLALRDVAAARQQLLNAGVPLDKIITFYNSGDTELLQNVQEDVKRLNKLLGFELRLPSVSNMWLYPASENTFDDFDWVRNQTFELVSSRIKEKNISGSIAELGVYRGDQAAIISRLFPDRPFYLFDTFEGFSQIDIQLEIGRFSESSTTDFSDTSLELVLSKLLNPERCLIKKGFFPETAKGLETNFCFVSLDVDLYAPTLAGLEYFYPRLEPGGAIFVHDYNNIRYKGVKQAVDEYLNKYHCPVMQIPDSAGSIIILK
jgi:O-methyltransferase